MPLSPNVSLDRRLRRRAGLVGLGLVWLLPAGCAPDAIPAAPTAAPPVMMETPQPDPEPAPAAPERARYQVRFEATWSRESHPQDPPDNPHFSPLVGATHDASVTFWAAGRLSSPGIQRMAETGSTSPLDQEIGQAVADGSAEQFFAGDMVRSPGTATLSFEASQRFPLVTLVTMVAPSPDWFTGVAGLALFADGAWREEVQVTLYPYDAGTDSGDRFMAADEETRPPVGVARITGFPFLVDGAVAPLGTFTFTRQP